MSLEEFAENERGDSTERLPDWAVGPADRLLTRELSEHIHNAILSLPEKYRLAVVLRDIEGFSTQETALILELTPANVKVRLHRARLYLRESLKGYFKHG